MVRTSFQAKRNWDVFFGKETSAGVNVERERVNAVCDSDARKIVLRQMPDVVVYKIRLAKEDPNWLREWRLKKYKGTILRLLIGHMYSGSTAEVALRTLIAHEKNPHFRQALEPAASALKAGLDIISALEVTRMVDPISLAILRTGKRAGDMKTAIDHAIAQANEKGRAMAMMMAKMFLFLWECVWALMTVLGDLFSLLPWMRSSFMATGNSSNIGASIDRAEVQHWILLWIFLLAAGAAFSLAIAYDDDDERKGWATRTVYKLPFLGRYLTAAAAADAFQALCRLIAAKVQINEAIEIVANTTTAPAVRDVFSRAAHLRRVKGASLDVAFKSPLLEAYEEGELRSYAGLDHLTRIFGAITERHSTEAIKARDGVVRAANAMFFTYLLLCGLSLAQLFSSAGLGLESVTQAVTGGNF